jgi:hypothetical protein
VTTLSIQATDRLEAQLKARSASESAPLYCELAPSESESDGLERLEKRDRARAVFAQRRYGAPPERSKDVAPVPSLLAKSVEKAAALNGAFLLEAVVQGPPSVKTMS